MAYYLLNLEFNPFIKYMQYLPVYGYKEIPRHYEEAILAYLSLGGKDWNNLAGFNISSKSKRDFADLTNIVMRYRNDKAAAYGAIMSKYSGTFWTYLLSNSIGSGVYK